MKKPHVRTRQIVEPSNLAGIGRGLNAHRMVAETAVEMANAHFEHYMIAYNELYRTMKDAGLTEHQMRVAFVAKIAPLLLEEARRALTDCLAQPDDECTPHMKAQIMDALVKDTDFRANRAVAAQYAQVEAEAARKAWLDRHIQGTVH